MSVQFEADSTPPCRESQGVFSNKISTIKFNSEALNRAALFLPHLRFTEKIQGSELFEIIFNMPLKSRR
jgi:hypothetical protein